MNSITICGSIGEPKFREVNTKTGKSEVASFGICQLEGRDKDNNPIFAWYNAEMWLNENSKLKQYIAKGAKVLAVGELKTDKWTAQDGTERSTIKIAIRALELVGGKQEQAPANTPAPATTPISAGAPQEDDLPF